MSSSGGAPTTDNLQVQQSSLPKRSEPAPPSRRLASVVRVAGIVLLVTFFLPWGSVFTSCQYNASGIEEGRYIGTMSGWDAAVGQDYPLPPSLDDSSLRVSLKPRPVAFFIPLIAIVIVGMSVAARASRVSAHVLHLTAVVGSVTVGLIFLSITRYLPVTTAQQPLPGQPDAYVPRLHLDLGWGAWLMIITLSVIGVSGIVGLVTPLWLREQRLRGSPQWP